MIDKVQNDIEQLEVCVAECKERFLRCAQIHVESQFSYWDELVKEKNFLADLLSQLEKLDNTLAELQDA